MASEKPMDPEQLNRLRQNLIKQTSDLLNVAKVDPHVLATLLMDCSCAVLSVMGFTDAAIAQFLRLHAAALEGDDKGATA